MSEDKKEKFVCSECGEYAKSMTELCSNCKSFKIVLVSVLEDCFGPNWKEMIEEND